MGVLYHLPGWVVTSKGRVAELDRIVIKHLFIQATKDKTKVYVLAVHLLRPIGAQADKQREAIGAWATGLLTREPGATVVIAGDTNNTDRQPLYGIGREVGELNNFAATHITNKYIRPPRGRRCRQMGRNRGSAATLRTAAKRRQQAGVDGPFLRGGDAEGGVRQHKNCRK